MSSESDTRHRKILLLISSGLFFLLVPISTFYIGKWIDSIVNMPSFPPFPFNYSIGPMVMAVGTIMAFKSIRILYKGGQGIPLGDLYPSAQSRYLLTSGIYAYTRNPMLFGYLLFLNGLGLIFQSLSVTFLQPLLYTAFWTVWIKKREEPTLERRFGEKYRIYRTLTPFLIPRPRRKNYSLLSI